LGKPSSNVPFMMPKRVAETDPNTQISDTTGSGPFIFKKDEWKPGDKAVYVKNPQYKPRHEAASGTAGRKGGQDDAVEGKWTTTRRTTSCAGRSSPAARRWSRPRGWRGCSSRTSANRKRC